MDLIKLTLVSIAGWMNRQQQEVTSVVLPEGLISLQWQAFADCTSLVSAWAGTELRQQL